MIKAIETVYNGYRFRSRLEARWAVFFDTLGIEYQYEPEGFDLGNGIWYLPDFWLPDFRLWIEIKGTEPTFDEQNKVALLAQGSGNNTAIFWSDFSRKSRNNALYFRMDSNGVFHSSNANIIMILVFSGGGWRNKVLPHIGEGDNFDHALQKAWTAARQARFERGNR